VKEQARTLRANTTDAERILWTSLRLLKHQGLHFRRQAPIDRFVVDFVCHRANLIVELDGSQHALEENIERDTERTAYLNSRGYRVLRFWNLKVVKNRDNVVGAIFEATKVPPPDAASAASTSPRWGR
jgi:very-short-patch-repair endonuclease